jgi:phage repressor protein C with HTH and peptisase S24 domain
MSSESDRLREARIAAGFASASDAARAMGVGISTYINHENGSAGLSRSAKRYSRFFRVSLDWLLHGKGDMAHPKAVKYTIPIHGLVGAGAAVEMIGDTTEIEPPDTIDMPGDGEIAGLIVRGESQWPRWLEGETILYDPRPVLPQSLIGKYAVVQATDGRRLIKLLRRGKNDRSWRLESHNAPPEEAELIGVWRYLGTIAAR